MPFRASRRAAALGQVATAELGHDDVAGPSVSDDVVHVKQQDVLGTSRYPHQRRPQQRPGRQVERAHRCGFHGRLRGCLARSLEYP